ncbi:hypothetical protein [Salinactinospora qingdaonensis]|uniref:Serine/threonine protein kinase n=1 Tax=Salinactinospora qingdaonensis TaxID=702744 RepID=A0ABP7GIH7_9ACTN
MGEPLHAADPRQVGAFRLEGRLRHSAAGVVYRGRDRRGAAVRVAVVSPAAVADAAARDRFVAAVDTGAGLAARPEVVAAATRGTLMWVATADVAGQAGAEVFLEPVEIAGASQGGRGPGYAPFWAGPPASAAPRWGWVATAGGPRPAGGAHRLMALMVVALVVLLVAAMVVVYLWLSQLRQEASSQPVPAPSASGGSPSPAPISPPSDGPSPTPSDSGAQSSPHSEVPSPVPSSDVPTVPFDEEELRDVPVQPGDPEGLA